MYVRTLIYGPASFFIKATLLLLIARVFAARERVAKALHLYILVLLISTIPIEMMKIIVCLPVHAYWDASVPNAKCLDQRRIFVVDRSMAIVTDTLILVTPIILSWALEISIQKKLKIAGLLGTGGAAVVITCFQMTKLVVFQTSVDSTADMVIIDITT